MTPSESPQEIPLRPTSRVDGIAKKALMFAAFLLGASASHSQATWSILLIPFMIAVLYVPLTEQVILPNWFRYVAYFAMAAVYVAVF
jgi:hypothetical protein